MSLLTVPIMSIANALLPALNEKNPISLPRHHNNRIKDKNVKPYLVVTAINTARILLRQKIITAAQAAHL
ncbi:hypothetical protein XBJ1_0937 [Xenorhabdus bovienii SS-2004]|uniref:Uncharacterized protein n=1 Tax=Xenorhabdus bovienii (strain SS-2004) TaxID=406818 RepID=D3UX33_XENBS|nr:hypothetical protein XBJ1_0937 [Xenorhabdus bovienii SS-2004]